MRQLIVLALFGAALVPGMGQTTVNAGPDFPAEPRAVVEAAAPFYDFTSPELKPWHLKASYQLYDLNGRPTEQGTWEYWWASPKVNHSRWTRSGMESDEWTTAEGAVYQKGTPDSLRYFERTIAHTLLPPVPVPGLLDSNRFKLDLKMVPPKKPELACVFASQQHLVKGKLKAVSPDMGDAYCFDPATKALRIAYSNPLTTTYNDLVKTQGRYLDKQISVTYDKQVLFSASVDVIEPFNPADGGINPPADAAIARHVWAPSSNVESDAVKGSLIKKTPPVYPLESKEAGEQGAVVLGVVIGTDGTVHDLEVLATPSPALSQAAVDAVKNWQYNPYLLNGHPVEVQTVINVFFRLGR